MKLHIEFLVSRRGLFAGWLLLRLLVGSTAAEFPVNLHAAGDQFAPDVAMDAQGNFVVAWQSAGQGGRNNSIIGRRFDRFGRPSSAEFRINIQDNATLPAVAIRPTGEFIVVWEGRDDSGKGIFARNYDAAGRPVTDAYPVNVTTLRDQTDPHVAVNDAGCYVIAWRGQFRLPSDAVITNIFCRVFDGSDAAAGPEQQVTDGTLTMRPAVGIDRAGDFVVIWAERFSKWEFVGLRRFEQGGQSPGPIQMAAATCPLLAVLDLTMNDAGEHVAVWYSGLEYGEEDVEVHGRWLRPDGTRCGEPFDVPTKLTGRQLGPSVAMDTSGHFRVALVIESDAQNDVLTVPYDACGKSAGWATRLNEFTDGDQSGCAIAMNAAGDRWVVVWQSEEQDGSGWGVYGALQAPPNAVERWSIME